LSDHVSTVESANLPPEVINLQIIHDQGLEELDPNQQQLLSSDAQHFEFVPQAFEVVPTSFSASHESGTSCVYYTFDPTLNQYNTIAWP
jgi:hypothetical protein